MSVYVCMIVNDLQNCIYKCMLWKLRHSLRKKNKNKNQKGKIEEVIEEGDIDWKIDRRKFVMALTITASSLSFYPIFLTQEYFSQKIVRIFN